MIVEVFIFVIGFYLLIKGSDYFIKSSSTIARRFGVSDFIIGLTLVAVGTSLPELSSTIFAALKDESALIVGEIIGSNIANIGLIGGFMAIVSVRATRVDKPLINRDGYLMIFAQILFLLFLLNRHFSWIEGIIFLSLYATYVIYLVNEKNRPNKRNNFVDFIRFFARFRYINEEKVKVKKKRNHESVSVKTLFDLMMLKQYLILLISGIAIFLGSKFLVEEAIFFANHFGIGTNIIGLTVIAIGTSLPELSVSIAAVRKNLGRIATGNIIGSCIANILLVIGVNSLITPLFVPKMTLFYSIPAMLVFSSLFVLFMSNHKKLTRLHGMILILLYVLFINSLIFVGKAM